MIQRKQTLYLLMVFLSCMVLIFGNWPLMSGELSRTSGGAIGKFQVFAASTVIQADTVVKLKSYMIYILIVNGLAVIAAIFLFKKLALQRRLTAFSLILVLLFIFSLIYAFYKLYSTEGLQLIKYNLNWACLFPILMLIFNLMAYRGIKKDIELLASADRLR